MEQQSGHGWEVYICFVQLGWVRIDEFLSVTLANQYKYAQIIHIKDMDVSFNVCQMSATSQFWHYVF